jgi:hypothetical protein
VTPQAAITDKAGKQKIFKGCFYWEKLIQNVKNHLEFPCWYEACQAARTEAEGSTMLVADSKQLLAKTPQAEEF